MGSGNTWQSFQMSQWNSMASTDEGENLGIEESALYHLDFQSLKC